MIELRADVELKDNIVVDMPKITKEGHYTCNVHVEYEWKPPRYSSCKVFGHIHEECPKNTRAGEKKTIKKPSQTSRGVPVGPKMAFKSQKDNQPVIKKPNANSSGNKKKGVEPTIEIMRLLQVVPPLCISIMMGSLLVILLLFLPGIVESDSEVEVVFDGSDKGYGTNSLLEQWMDSYPDNNNYDPYDDDMYENHDMSEHLQSICDDLDIT
ncbi:hypothetical protein Tco_1051954, partial [Tanacetum coccineum]